MFGINVSWNDADCTETTAFFPTKEKMFEFAQEAIRYGKLIDEDIIYFVTYSKDEIEKYF